MLCPQGRLSLRIIRGSAHRARNSVKETLSCVLRQGGISDKEASPTCAVMRATRIWCACSAYAKPNQNTISLKTLASKLTARLSRVCSARTGEVIIFTAGTAERGVSSTCMSFGENQPKGCAVQQHVPPSGRLPWHCRNEVSHSRSSTSPANVPT